MKMLTEAEWRKLKEAELLLQALREAGFVDQWHFDEADPRYRELLKEHGMEN
jgi:hypothetical protein